jgi:uncharacterized membrane protein
MRLSIAFVIVTVVAVSLLPLGMALAQEANLDRTLPGTVERGETFTVTVTFTAAADEFNSVGLTDLAPEGWEVDVDKEWCSPEADVVNAAGNKAEIMWFGPYLEGTDLSVMYKVTVPVYACAGKHTFDGFLEYYLEEEGPYLEKITGDVEVEVPVYPTKPLICCSPKSLNFSAVEGGSSPANQILEISNSGVGTISWTLSDDVGWLSENPTGGDSTGPGDETSVVVSVDKTGMSAGDYSASITITAAGANNSPQTVPVSLHIGSPAPEISFGPESLSFTAVEGSSAPADETLDIWNSGVDRLDWSLSDGAAWLSEDPTRGSSIGEHDTVAVSVGIAGMSAGDYSADITITAPGASNSPQTVSVSLHISSAAPEISFKPKSLSFTAGEGGSNPASETLEIWNSGVDTLHWTLSDDAEWLSENPTSGSSMTERDTVVLSVDIADMPDGDYSTSITITAPGASNSPQTVPVTLYVGGIGPPLPAQFTIANLDVTPGQVLPGQPVTVSVQVANIGGGEGSYTVNLTVNGQVEQTKMVTLAPEAMETVTFTVTKETPGSYTISIGNLTEEFTVAAPSWLSRYWWTIVVGVVAVVLLAYFLWRKRAV